MNSLSPASAETPFPCFKTCNNRYAFISLEEIIKKMMGLLYEMCLNSAKSTLWMIFLFVDAGIVSVSRVKKFREFLFDSFIVIFWFLIYLISKES